MEINVAENEEHPGEYRVEYFGDDGECYAANFSGPESKYRAAAYKKYLQMRDATET